MHTYKHIHAAIRRNGMEGLVFFVVGRVEHLKRTEQKHRSGTHTSTYTAAILTHTNTDTNTHIRTYAHIQTHIQTRMQTHTNTHTRTYAHIQARKCCYTQNGREGLVFPVLGRVEHLE